MERDSRGKARESRNEMERATNALPPQTTVDKIIAFLYLRVWQDLTKEEEDRDNIAVFIYSEGSKLRQEAEQSSAASMAAH